MRALLDISFLAAAFDPDHIMHGRADSWWLENKAKGWASCPLTENGVIRVMANILYARKQRVDFSALVRLFQQFVEDSDHQFWPDAVSLLNQRLFDFKHLVAARQMTDCYLLALAVENNSRLVTFDQGISLKAVPGASARNLVVL